MRQLFRKKQEHAGDGVIRPYLTPEEAHISWGLQLQGIFKRAGVDKYLHETPVQGGMIRLAIPDEGGLCDHPDCPHDYKYALRLDGFRNMMIESHGTPFEDFTENAKQSMNGGMAMTIMVCEDHQDWRPSEIPHHRYADDYVFRPGKGASGIRPPPLTETAR